MTDLRQRRLTVVSVLYRSAEILAHTLPTWARSAQGHPVDFAFVDHSPDEKTERLIADQLAGSPHTYHADPSNPGFAAGCNRGVASATGSHVMLLNPDVWLNDDSFARVMAAAGEHPDSPIAIGMVMAGRSYLGIDLSPVGLFADRSAGAGRGPLGPSGGAAVFPVEAYRRSGGLYEPMFAWGEDADLAFRLHAGGYRTRTLDLELRHEWGHSVTGDGQLARFKAFLLARNRIWVGVRALTWPMLLLGLPVAVAAHAALAVRKAGQGLLPSFLNGVLRGLLGAPEARRRWQGRRFGVAMLISYWRPR